MALNNCIDIASTARALHICIHLLVRVAQVAARSVKVQQLHNLS